MRCQVSDSSLDPISLSFFPLLSLSDVDIWHLHERFIHLLRSDTPASPA